MICVREVSPLSLFPRTWKFAWLAIMLIGGLTVANAQSITPLSPEQVLADMQNKAADYLDRLEHGGHLLNSQVISLNHNRAPEDLGDAITHTSALVASLSWAIRATGDPHLYELMENSVAAINTAFAMTGSPGVACRAIVDGTCYEPGNLSRSFMSRDNLMAITFAYANAYPVLHPGPVRDALVRNLTAMGDNLLANNMRLEGLYQGKNLWTVHVNLGVNLDRSDVRYMLLNDPAKSRNFVRQIRDFQEWLHGRHRITVPVTYIAKVVELQTEVKAVEHFIEHNIGIKINKHFKKYIKKLVKVIDYVPVTVSKVVEKKLTKQVGIDYRPDELLHIWLNHCIEDKVTPAAALLTGGLDLLAQTVCGGGDALFGHKSEARDAADLVRSILQLIDSVGGEERSPDDAVVLAFFREVISTLNQPDDELAAQQLNDIIDRHWEDALPILLNRILHVTHNIDKLPALARILTDGVGGPHNLLTLLHLEGDQKELLETLLHKEGAVREALAPFNAALPGEISRLEELKVLGSNGLMAAALLKTAAFVTGEERFHSAYTRVAMEAIQVTSTWGTLYDELLENVFGRDKRTAATSSGASAILEPMALYVLGVAIPDDAPEIRAAYQQIARKAFHFMADEGLSFQNIVAIELGVTEGEQVLVDAVTSLVLFPPYSTEPNATYKCSDPKVQLLFGGCISFFGGHSVARTAIPMDLRPRHPMTWSSPARELAAADNVYAGPDYLLAFYLAQFHRVLTPSVLRKVEDAVVTQHKAEQDAQSRIDQYLACLANIRNHVGHITCKL